MWLSSRSDIPNYISGRNISSGPFPTSGPSREPCVGPTYLQTERRIRSDEPTFVSWGGLCYSLEYGISCPTSRSEVLLTCLLSRGSTEVSRELRRTNNQTKRQDRVTGTGVSVLVPTIVEVQGKGFRQWCPIPVRKEVRSRFLKVLTEIRKTKPFDVQNLISQHRYLLFP